MSSASSAFYLAASVVHLASVVVLVGSVVMLDLRLLGLSRDISVRRLARHILPWAAASLLLLVPTGLLMFVTRINELIASPVLALKVCLVFAALANAVLLQVGAMRRAAAWDTDVMPPLGARAAAAASLALWACVLVCGRLLVDGQGL